MKVLITLPFNNKHIQRFNELPYEFIYINEKNMKFDIDLSEISILMCYNPFNSIDVSKMKNLKLIQLSSIGIDQVPINLLQKNKISLCNNNGGYKVPISEWIIWRILAHFKNEKNIIEKNARSLWKIDMGLKELTNKNILFIGTGNIACETAIKLKAFNVNLIGLNKSGKKVSCFDEIATISKLNDYKKIADIIVLALPLTSETEGLLDENFFSNLKPTAYFINISRGQIVNESALLNALNNNLFAGCSLDVFKKEPLPSNHMFWDNDRIFISPHNSWVSEFIQERRFNLFYENLVRFNSNLQLRNLINLNQGY